MHTKKRKLYLVTYGDTFMSTSDSEGAVRSSENQIQELLPGRETTGHTPAVSAEFVLVLPSVDLLGLHLKSFHVDIFNTEIRCLWMLKARSLKCLFLLRAAKEALLWASLQLPRLAGSLPLT